eukprot:8392420-Pyramimonas_sp.AAC.1
MRSSCAGPPPPLRSRPPLRGGLRASQNAQRPSCVELLAHRCHNLARLPSRRRRRRGNSLLVSST